MKCSQFKSLFDADLYRWQHEMNLATSGYYAQFVFLLTKEKTFETSTICDVQIFQNL